jgi:aspartate carbamoyltransferase regulatory subunit
MSRLQKVSVILNDSKVYDKIAEALGIELDNDSCIFREIEEYIIEQYDYMDNNRPLPSCSYCGDDIDEDSRYCSYDCSKADNKEKHN